MLFFVESGENADAVEEPNADVATAWAVEAEGRWREIESGVVKTIPSEEVRAKLLHPCTRTPKHGHDRTE